MIKKLSAFAKHLNNAYGFHYFKERKAYNDNHYELASISHEQKILAQEGIVKLPNLPESLIDLYINITKLDNQRGILKRESDCAPGVSERLIVSLNNKDLQDYIEANVLPHIQGYFGKEYVMRGNPRVIYNKPTERQPADRFHIDYGLHQLTLQVLLTNVTEKDTHMEYIKGSNKSTWFHPRASLFPAKKPMLFKKNLKRELLVAEAGSAYLFDAGNGYHRARTSNNKNSYRKVLSINFSAKTHLNLASDYYQPIDEFENTLTNSSSLYKPFKKK